MLRNRLHVNPQISSMDDPLNSLNERSERSKAKKLWSDTLIKGLFITAAFDRGANEQDFRLYLAALKAVLVTVMPPYFAATGCHNYLRIGLFVIHHTPFKRLQEFNNHNCCLRLIPRLNNSIFTEQLIESTYMRLGHQPGGATCLVVKCPDDELCTQLRRLWRGKFQPRHNVRECAPDSQRPKGGVSEEHF